MPALDGDSEISLTFCLSKKSIECTSNNEISVKIPNYSYVLANKSILCNCKLEAEETFLLDSLPDDHPQLENVFVVNLAYVHYFNNQTDSVMATPSLDDTENEQELPVTLQDFSLNTSKWIN